MLLLIAPLVLQGTPTLASVEKRCQAAYDAVKTFEQNVSGDISGMKGTAHISFSRPGFLRVTGNTLMGSKYDLISDGKKTSLLNAGTWSEVKNAEMGIATITGISANAGTLVPATLLHTSWGSLSGYFRNKATVRTVKVQGKSLLLVQTGQPDPSSIWIDPKTYFVVKTEMSAMGRIIAVSFSEPKVNAAIPATRFRK